MDNFIAAAQPQALATIDADTTRIATGTDQLIARSSAFNCVDRAAFHEGADALREIKRIEKQLEERRTKVTGPLNEALRQINAWFRGPVEKLKRAESNYKQRMGAFEQLEREREREANAKAEREAREQREELERRAKSAADKGQAEKAHDLSSRAADVVPRKADIIPPKAAGMGFGEAWEWEMVDAALIPREYLTIDNQKIGLLVRALKNKEQAERQIPGIRVFSKPKVSVRA